MSPTSYRRVRIVALGLVFLVLVVAVLESFRDKRREYLGLATRIEYAGSAILQDGYGKLAFRLLNARDRPALFILDSIETKTNQSDWVRIPLTQEVRATVSAHSSARIGLQPPGPGMWRASFQYEEIAPLGDRAVSRLTQLIWKKRGLNALTVWLSTPVMQGSGISSDQLVQ